MKSWRELPKWDRDNAIGILRDGVAAVERVIATMPDGLARGAMMHRSTALKAAIAALEELAREPDEPPSR
jgi:hypothetical protein